MNSDVGRTGAHWVGAWSLDGGRGRTAESEERGAYETAQQTDSTSKEWRAGWKDGWMDGWMGGCHRPFRFGESIVRTFVSLNQFQLTSYSPTFGRI